MIAAESIHHRFTAVAQCNSDRAALAFRVDNDWKFWSYSQLVARSQQIAQQMLREGVAPGAAIGLVVDRHPDTIAAAIAAFEIGAYIVPVSEVAPQSRGGRILALAGVQIVVTPCAPVAGDDSISVSSTAMASSDRSSAVLSLPGRGDGSDLAYVMFTSGSTGQPKGVAVPHRAITRLVLDQDYVLFDSTRVFLQAAPMNFDASLFEIWGALLHGGLCVLFPSNVPITSQVLRDVITSTSVTTAWIPASLFDAVVSHDVMSLSSLSELVIGGEALSVDHVRRAYAALPDVKIVNGYGPTENTTFTTCYEIPRDLPASLTRIPIGRAINGTDVVVVDDSLQQVEPGTEGELLAMGSGLALGYLGDPALSRELFVTVARSDGQRCLCYRTGDRVVELEGGMLDFIGRRDDQVKIHGNRIEPIEIETVIAGLPGVDQCRVRVQIDGSRKVRLIAYVVLDHGASLDALKQKIVDVLPPFMVPNEVYALSALPLNANGKLDVAQLAATVNDASQTGDMNIVERAWHKVLGQLPVTSSTNFFDAGGRSLEAIRLHDLLEREVDFSLEPTFTFEFTTTGQQLDELSRMQAAAENLCGKGSGGSMGQK